jgi:hypothetical protein
MRDCQYWREQTDAEPGTEKATVSRLQNRAPIPDAVEAVAPGVIHAVQQH